MQRDGSLNRSRPTEGGCPTEDPPEPPVPVAPEPPEPGPPLPAVPDPPPLPPSPPRPAQAGARRRTSDRRDRSGCCCFRRITSLNQSGRISMKHGSAGQTPPPNQRLPLGPNPAQANRPPPHKVNPGPKNIDFPTPPTQVSDLAQRAIRRRSPEMSDNRRLLRVWCRSRRSGVAAARDPGRPQDRRSAPPLLRSRC